MNIIRRVLRNYYDSVFLFLLTCVFISLFFPGHAVASVTTIIFVFYGLILLLSRDYSLGLRPVSNWFFIMYYATILISGIWATDMNLFIEKSSMKSILVGVPFVFLVYKHFPNKYFSIFSDIIIALIFISSIYVLINYTKDFGVILQKIKEGQSMSVPFRNHIRYSIFVNFALLLCLQRANTLWSKRNKTQFWILAIAAVYLFVFIQFLAIKSGIVISFITVICFSVHKVLQTREFVLGAVLLVSFCIFSVFILGNIPTVKNKFSYFKYDLQQYKNNQSAGYSDSERIESIKRGIEIVKQHFPLGIGEGNLYDMQPGEDKVYKLPHNEFVVVLAQNGLLGFVFLSLAIVSLLVTSVNDKNWLLFTYTVSMIFSLSIEPMLETQIGLVMFILPLCLFNSLKNIYK